MLDDGCLWMLMDAYGCLWMLMDAYGCLWMLMDASGRLSDQGVFCWQHCSIDCEAPPGCGERKVSFSQAS